MADVVLLEPWFKGSHAQWCIGWQQASRHNIAIVAGPEGGWRKSLRAGPAFFANQLEKSHQTVDVIVASSPIDLAGVIGCSSRLFRNKPFILYMHESQFGYPPGLKGPPADHLLATDFNAIKASTRTLVASNYHRELLTKALPEFAEELVLGNTTESMAAFHIDTLPVGVGLIEPRLSDLSGPPRILWNHRWSADKDPEGFVSAIKQLALENYDFEVIAIGPVERSGSTQFLRLKKTLGPRLIASGEQSRNSYISYLQTADIVVSTSRHEFFGVSVVEAISAGVRPLLPNRLSYPELVPGHLRDSFLYSGDIYESLAPLLMTTRSRLHENRDALIKHVESFNWRSLVHDYDDLVDNVAGQVGEQGDLRR
ncbi:MAG: hypothetical protein CL504_07765 [Actinobacteria bacterium]|nr:hypothetical protein [Actinomycetota bacterium]